MVGKPDWGRENISATAGQFAPGEKAYRAWDEGWIRRYNDGALSKPNTTHAANTVEFQADQAGWSEADNQLADSRRRMPYVFGSPP